jgi:hypothetical protein
MFAGRAPPLLLGNSDSLRDFHYWLTHKARPGVADRHRPTT